MFFNKWYRNKNNRKKRLIYGLLTPTFLALLLALSSVSLMSQEASNREELIPVFKRHFGFEPPSSVHDINAKLFYLYDSEVEWMCFTYDSNVLLDIVRRDTLLEEVLPKSGKYYDLIGRADNSNRPEWFEKPNANSNDIYYKEDYLSHVQSDFVLWVNEERTTVYLQTSYHD